MNNEIREDLYKEKYNEYVNNFIKNIIMDNPIILKEYPILEVEYNVDGTKKDIYSLASERDIKKMQIKSDENELDYKFSQNKISKKEYDENVKKLKKKEEEQDLLYDDLIFEIINLNDSRTVKESIIKYNLNNIDLSRLAEAIKSVSENKIEEFRKNNNDFMIAQFLDIRLFRIFFRPDSHPQSLEHITDFLTFEDLVIHRFFHIQYLTAQR